MSIVSEEGKAPFAVSNAGKACFTWYKIFGDLSGGTVPLIILHEGPGIPHNYMLSMVDLASQHSIPVVLYDQVGCGNSTALPEKDGDGLLWTPELFEQELDNLVGHLGLPKFDLLGHSCDGMFAAGYASKGPRRLRKLVLAHVPASVELFLQGIAARRLELPQSVQDTINEHELNQDFEAKAYTEAVEVFYKRFFCRLDEWPVEVLESDKKKEHDATVYSTMYGPTEVTCTGNLKTWTAIPFAHRIKNRTLLINGEFDEVVEAASAPYFERIPKIKWIFVPDASHMSHWKQREQFVSIISRFLIDTR